MEETGGNTVEVLGPGRVHIVMDGPIDEADAQAMIHGCRQAGASTRNTILAGVGSSLKSRSRALTSKTCDPLESVW